LPWKSRSDAAQAENLRAGLLGVFADVRAVVRDWRPMMTRLAGDDKRLAKQSAADSGIRIGPKPSLPRLAEGQSFHLSRLPRLCVLPRRRRAAGRAQSSGLGCSPIRNARRAPRLRSFQPDAGSARIPNTARPADNREIGAAFFPVHRRVHMDYVGVKTFNAKGELSGERRFIGLFTSTAYSQLPASIPVLRRKTAQVMTGSGLPAASHDGKALQHVLDTFPRDELFQISEDELLATARWDSQSRRAAQVRVFLRFDRFDRYVSASSSCRASATAAPCAEKIHAILARAFNGRLSAAMPMLDNESIGACALYRRTQCRARPDVDVKELEAEIRAAIRTWDDGLPTPCNSNMAKQRAIWRGATQTHSRPDIATVSRLRMPSRISTASKPC